MKSSQEFSFEDLMKAIEKFNYETRVTTLFLCHPDIYPQLKEAIKDCPNLRARPHFVCDKKDIIYQIDLDNLGLPDWEMENLQRELR